MKSLPLASLLLLTACTTKPTMPEFEAARAAALKAPPPVGDDWQPDATLMISPALTRDLIRTGLDSYGTIDDPIALESGGEVKPDLTVQKVVMGAKPSCPTCLDIQARVDGTVGYMQGGLGAQVAVDATVHVVVEVSAKDAGAGTWDVQLAVKDVSKVQINKSKLPNRLVKSVDKALLSAARKALLDQAKPRTVATFEPEEMPLRAVRAASVPQGIRVDMLTAASSPTPIGKIPPRFSTGWQFSIQSDSLMDLARKQSFEDGVIAWEVVAEPKALRMRGSTYEMDLRLWMISGSGWWRDYTVTGAIEPTDEGFALTTGEIVKTGMSEGAETVDPLAAIGESQIIENIAASLNASLPKSTSGSASDHVVKVDLASVAGAAGMVHVRGDLKVKKRGANR